MEHVEFAGVHSGDSACVIPATTLSDAAKNQIREHCYALARELGVIGLMNVQFAIRDEDVYILEVNPRASRTIPFVSKAIGKPLAKIATAVMTGKSLEELDFTSEIIPTHYSVKEAVFPFIRFPGSDITLSPEMRSTGEVMGIDDSFGVSYIKSQMAAGNTLPKSGNVFLSVRDADKSVLVPFARRLDKLGYTIYATLGTSTVLRDNGIASEAVFKISSGRPNALDMIRARKLGWIVNTPSSGTDPKIDEIRMRAEAVIHGVPITTTMSGLNAAVSGLEAFQAVGKLGVRSLQDYHKDVVH